jgi:hypothetical protein
MIIEQRADGFKERITVPNPRDPKPQWGVPVNPWTGYPITENQQRMLDRLREACREVGLVLHATDGSDPDGYGFSARRTSIAGTHLEQLQLIAMREILDK